MPLVTDLVDPAELVGYVRGIQIEEERNRFLLNAYLPNNTVDEIEWRLTTAALRDEDAAMVRSWDTEAPIGARQGATRMYGELAPISKKIRLGEEERLRQRMLERGNGDTAEIGRAIYNDATRMTRAVLARVEMLRGEALQNAQMVVNENGVVATINYGRTGGHTVTAGTKWDTATPTPVADMRSWVQTYINTNGVAPAVGMTSTQVISALMLVPEIRALATSISGVPGIVSAATVQAVFAAYGLPPLVAYDTAVRVGGVVTRVTDPKKLTFLPPANEPLGETRWGPTAEGLVLAAANFITVDEAEGVMATIWSQDDPVSTWTKGNGVALPLMPNPDLTFTATVLT